MSAGGERSSPVVFGGSNEGDASNTFGAIHHFYQPFREIPRWSRPNSHERAGVLPEVNGEIHEECYRRVLASPEGIPQGLTLSFYGSLREWMKIEQPADFEQARQNIRDLGSRAEWQVLADPFFHNIMPLKPRKTQDMLVKIGLAAIWQDFGIKPRGFWLPETAVDNTTLEVLAQNGIEFVALRDSQVPDMVDMGTNVVYADLGLSGHKIAIVRFDSVLSGTVSFEDWITVDADGFLQGRRKEGRDVNIATDGELFGHHKEFRDMFIRRAADPEVQRKYCLQPLDMEHELKVLAEAQRSARVLERTSWSCLNGHELGRWTGDARCGCDGEPSRESRSFKRQLFQTLDRYGQEIDRRLDAINPDWRDKFVAFALAIKGSIYGNSSVGESIAKLAVQPGFEFLTNSRMRDLYLARFAGLMGETSCFNFFGGKERPERQIAQVNIREIKRLLPDIDRVGKESAQAAV